MKLKNLILAVTAAICTASCNEYNALFSEDESNLSSTLNEFTENFETRYGKIDPNHNWGFGEMEPYGTTTRATVEVNVNEWVGKYSNIPGYPFLNDEYIQIGVSNNMDNKSVIKPIAEKNTSSDFVMGDVTNYEVQIVSEWFRTYKEGDPEFEAAKVSLNVSEFFIQNVSADNDRTIYPNGEKITQIGPNQNGNLEPCDFNMDYIQCKDIDGSWTHISNFNSGNTNHNADQKQANWRRQLKLITSAGTSDFSAEISFNDDNKTTTDWVLVRLTWEEEYNGKKYSREGYYLAFDYSAQKNSSGLTYPRDKYYSNWIVKITPAKYIPTPQVRRIMCEDLGNTYDFDFNDVVFDVSYEETWWPEHIIDAIIVLQCAGGTMPIYVGTKDDAHEAHKLMNNNNYKTPINVKDNGAKSEVVTYRLKSQSSTDPDLIPVYVHNTNTGQDYTINSHRANLDKYNNGVVSNAEAPQKFCVPTSVRWMKEEIQIEESYPKFKDWVQNERYMDGENHWYDNPQNTEKLWPAGSSTSTNASGSTNGTHINFTPYDAPVTNAKISINVYEADGVTLQSDPWNSGCFFILGNTTYQGNKNGADSNNLTINQSYSYSITVAEGYELIENTLGSTSGTITAKENMDDIVITFKKKQQYTVTVTVRTYDADETTVINEVGGYMTLNGQPISNGQSTTFYKGQSVSYKAVANDGYEFWKFEHANGVPSEYTFNISNNENMVVAFKKKSTSTEARKRR